MKSDYREYDKDWNSCDEETVEKKKGGEHRLKLFFFLIHNVHPISCNMSLPYVSHATSYDSPHKG